MAHTSFTGGMTGQWRVTSIATLVGPPLASVEALAISQAPAVDGAWRLTGVASYVRYVERAERQALVSRQAGLGRTDAVCAALIPIAKSQAWWDMTQDERRQIFEGKSRHIAASLKYLPAIARQLYHCRDLGEPFDFLTWFEFAPEHEPAFEELLAGLRSAEEWRYVTREIDIRLTRDAQG